MSVIRRLMRPRIIIGGGIVVFFALAALLAPVLPLRDPASQALLHSLLPPAWAPGGNSMYLLGTDSLGRDVLAHLVYGARTALYVAVLAATGAMLLGTTLALLAGYFGGWIDWLVARAVDTWMSFPPVVLALILLVGFGVGINNVVLAIIIVDWTRFARVIRSEVIVIRRRDYIAAARLSGFSHLRTLVSEVLPATLPLILTLFSLEMGIAVIIEATLSFVGLSVESNVPSWGVMIADARVYIYQTPWGVMLPVLAIFSLVLAFNLLGDGLRAELDPKLRQRGGATP